MTSNKPRGKHAKHSKEYIESLNEADAHDEAPSGSAEKSRDAKAAPEPSSSTSAPEPVGRDVPPVKAASETVALKGASGVKASSKDDSGADAHDPFGAFELSSLHDPVEEAASGVDASLEAPEAESAAETVAIAPAADGAADGDAADDAAADASETDTSDKTVALPVAPAIPVIGAAASADETIQLEGDASDGTSVSPQAPNAQGDVDGSGFDVDGDTLRELDNWRDASMAYMPEFELTKKRRRNAGKVVAITLGAIVGVAALVYVAGVIAFSNLMMPNTVIGEMDVSLKSNNDVAQMVEEEASKYTLDVIGNGFSYRTDAKGVGLKIDSYGVVDAVHQDLPSWQWPALVFQSKHDETDCFKTTYSPIQYQEDVKAAVAKYNESATPPTNATLEYDQATNSFKVKEEVAGTQLDDAAVLAAMAEGIEALSSKVTLGEDELLKPAILSTDAKIVDAAKFATNMVSANIPLTLNGQQVGNVGPDELAQCIMMNENYEVSLNEVLLYEWVEGVANNYNTKGSERTYTRADGKVISISGGSYGWEVDVEALKNAIVEHVKAANNEAIEIPCTSTAQVYSGKGARDWGNRYIDIDLAEQYVRFYGDDGSIIWESACISGKPDGVHDTSTGVFVINNKRSPEKLIGYENGVKIYESNVTYWMPFDGNAIGLHDADWQPGFGGTMYADGYGSHGCVNLPPYAAAELYSIVNPGDVVVSHW